MFFPDCSTVIRGAARLVASAPRPVAGAPQLVAGTTRCSQVHPQCSPVPRGVPKPRTITPMVLLYQSSEISVTLKADRNALLGSETLLKLTHVSLHSTSSLTPLEASSNNNTLCWWTNWYNWNGRTQPITSVKDRKYGTCISRVRVVFQPHTDDDAAEPAPTSFAELMEWLDIVPGISQMPQRTFRPCCTMILL